MMHRLTHTLTRTLTHMWVDAARTTGGQTPVEVDAGMTSIQTGGGRRWDGQRMELQVRMEIWKLWKQTERKKGTKQKPPGTMKLSSINELLLINSGSS